MRRRRLRPTWTYPEFWVLRRVSLRVLRDAGLPRYPRDLDEYQAGWQALEDDALACAAKTLLLDRTH